MRNLYLIHSHYRSYSSISIFRSQEELVDDIPEPIAEEPAHTLPHAQTVPPSPVVESLAQLTARCRSQSSYLNQVRRNSIIAVG